MNPRAEVRRLELPPGRRVLVVSDIHGNLPLLQGLLAKAAFSQEDVLIVLGDIMERSTGSLDTLRYVMELSRTHTVHTLLGNCDNITRAFFQPQDGYPDDFFAYWFGRMGEKCALVYMAKLAGVRVDAPADYPAARRAIAALFAPELEFLAGLPTILLSDHYLFVHGGVPREDRLEELSAYSCMKNDDFLSQGLGFRRWVIVGHWPVTLYRPTLQSAAPILLQDRHIASIDGGCTLKSDGQLNALILPKTPGEGFTWLSYDGLPTVTALDCQAPSGEAVNIRYGRSRVEVLERGAEFSRCRHVESGRELDILTDFLYEKEGATLCQDATDYLLPVEPGDTITLVRETGRGLLAKKDGVTGWYQGRWQSEREGDT